MKTISISQWVAAVTPFVRGGNSGQGGTGNLPVPFGNLPNGMGKARGFSRLAEFVGSLLPFRQASGPTAQAGHLCYPLIFVALLFATSTRAQITNLSLGNLAPGESVTVIYEVTINNSLPPTLQGITNQAAVSATGVTTVNSDDPKTGALNDPTVTLLVQAPSVVTVAASGVGAESATLNGLVNPGGDASGYYFEYTTNLAFELKTVTNLLAASYTTSAVSIAVSGLLPNTTYQFRVRATNSMGLTGGNNLSFTTTVFTITSQPLNVGACVGNTASFFVGVNAPGSATYQWQRRNPGAGAFNDILGATSANYQTPPLTAADDGAGYRVIASAPGTNLTSSEALVSVISLATPAVTYDFNSGLPPNTAVYGSAFLSNGVLVLTTNGGGLQGGFLTADLAPGRVVRGFTASFKLRIANGSGQPADGFSFNWAPNLPNDSTGEEGAGSGLTVSFDIYDNGFGEAPAIDVKWNSNVVSHTSVPLSFLSAFDGSFRTASIRLNSDGTIDIIYNCTPVLTHFAVPGYAPQLGGRFLLGARTGGEYESHSIDDLALQLDVDPTNGVPRITSVKTNGTGGLTIIGTGTSGSQLALLAATNLASPANWSFRATVIPNGSGVFTFTEPSISSPPHRFYKLSAAPQLPTNLVTWWRAESNYLDSFGGNHGSAAGIAPSFTNGQRGLAFSFNGTNQAMLIPGSPIPVPWTAAFWVKRQDATDVSASLLTDTLTALKLEQAPGTRRVGFTLYNVQDYSFSYIVPTNTWTHLAFVGTPGGTILYTNGVSSETNAATINLPLLILGARPNGVDHLKGLVDETTIFNRALTPAEIQQVINATRGP